MFLRSALKLPFLLSDSQFFNQSTVSFNVLILGIMKMTPCLTYHLKDTSSEGIILGVVENLSKAYISSQLSDVIVFSLLIIILLVRPTGILGKKINEKV